LKTDVATYTAALLKRQWLSDKSFEIILSVPRRFEFQPGQRMRLSLNEYERDYSIVSAPGEPELALCIRSVAGGKLSTLLAAAEAGTSLTVSGPCGYFTYKPSPRPAVFVATGTGIAPFCSMARSGTSGFTLLHGVRLPEDLYYAPQFRSSAHKYIPCLTGAKSPPANAFQGKVNECLERHFAPAAYDFYLCGRSEMIRDVTLLIDERFPESLVYTELFY
jgi:benzoate/toluate 1,2-dioxygenase reductase subunit